MNWVSTSICCLTLTLSSALQASNTDRNTVDSTQKLRAIASLLQALWGRDFDSNYEKYMLGSSPTVVLISRLEMMQIAEARLDGRRRDGTTTQGLTISRPSQIRIFVVYDDIAPLLVAQTINHELGHLLLKDKGFSRNKEEARVRKTVDTAFFRKLFGREWFEATVSLLEKKVTKVEKNGRVYRGYTPAAVDAFYEQLRKAGAMLENNPLHDRIIGHIVFILTNSEKKLAAALDAEDQVD
jgi:hypothetical protein